MPVLETRVPSTSSTKKDYRDGDDTRPNLQTMEQIRMKWMHTNWIIWGEEFKLEKS
jgi:hypothetical protein